jgi:hypothetical protein
MPLRSRAPAMSSSIGHDKFPAVVNVQVALGGAAWILALLFFAGHLISLTPSTVVLAGACTLLGAVLTWPAWPSHRLTNLGLVLVAVGGIAESLVGLTSGNLRLALDVVGVLGANIGVLLLGALLWQAGHWEGGAGIACALFGLVGWIPVPGLGVASATIQSLAAYPEAVWLAAIGSLLLASTARLGSWRSRVPSTTKSGRSGSTEEPVSGAG